MVDPRTRIELEAVAGMIEQLDYYQVLRVPPHSDRRTLEKGFVTESRKFHPDRFHALGDRELQANATQIFRRVSEAWSVLKDPQLRAAYDRRRSSGQTAGRITKADLQQESQQQAGGPEARTAQGRRYIDTAAQAVRKGDLRGAIMQAQFAAMAEPTNEGIKTWIETLKSKAQGG